MIGQNEIPQELADMIGQKKNEEFKLTYTDGADLYIAVGYGEQPTGGYSITVPEFYLTENSIVIKTELQGPESTEQAGNSPSFPYIVIKNSVYGGTGGFPVVFIMYEKISEGHGCCKEPSLSCSSIT